MSAPTKNRPKTSRIPGRLKIAGTAVLLASFITQQFLLNEADSLIRKLDQYHNNYTSAYQSSLLYVNRFLIQSQVTGVADGTVLTKAAQDHAAGFALRLLSIGLPQSQQKDEVEQLFKEAARVIDLDHYNSYMAYINTKDQKYFQNGIDRDGQMRLRRAHLNRAYLVLNICGSLLLLIGMIVDERAKP